MFGTGGAGFPPSPRGAGGSPPEDHMQKVAVEWARWHVPVPFRTLMLDVSDLISFGECCQMEPQPSVEHSLNALC